MGILLTFMFVWNMVGALVLIPALSYFLLNDRHFECAAATERSGVDVLPVFAEGRG